MQIYPTSDVSSENLVSKQKILTDILVTESLYGGSETSAHEKSHHQQSSSPSNRLPPTDRLYFSMTVVSQPYQTEVNNAHVIVGNSGVLACVVPSFVADFVQVSSWEDSAGGSYFPSSRHGNY